MDDFLKKVHLMLRNLYGTESDASPTDLMDPDGMSVRLRDFRWLLHKSMGVSA
jgi:hypothetical protein